MKISQTMAGFCLAALLGACGGGGGNDGATGGGGASITPTAPLASTPIATTTSYANFKQIGLAPQALPPGDNTVRAYGDFTGNGRPDLFRAVITYNPGLPVSQATPSRFEFYARQSDGRYAATTALPPQAGCLHPRKAIVADFNNDGRPDVFVACRGYNAAPFPGETNKVVLSQPDGRYQVSDASLDVGFNHGATAADLNGDGKVDVVVVNNFDPDRAYVLLNDGTGHFTRESPSRLPASMRSGNYYSVELVDINEDGKLDLLLGGHEFEGAPTAIFLNPGANNFSGVVASVVPAVPNQGVVLDFTITGSGASRALWVLRTSGGDGSFYQSKVVQKVQFPSLASSVVLSQQPAEWIIPWLIPAVVNGVNVITSDNLDDAVLLPQ